MYVFMLRIVGSSEVITKYSSDNYFGTTNVTHYTFGHINHERLKATI